MAKQRDLENARKNRLEIIKAGLGRRELCKLGLLTSAGYLVHKKASGRAPGPRTRPAQHGLIADAQRIETSILSEADSPHKGAIRTSAVAVAK